MKYAIVTGVSRGLGASAAKYMLESGIHLIGISRSKNEELHVIAGENNVDYEHIECDLSDLDELNNVIEALRENVLGQELTHLYLINNAAMVGPIEKAQETSPEALKQHYHLNVLTPMILMNTIIKESNNALFIGANITSGAADKPTYGWSAYCSSKASIDMYTKTVALEQKELGTNHKVFGFSPGIMDTDMQEKIRSATPQQFVNVDTFKGFHEQNLLSDTDEVASILVDIMTDEGNIESGKKYSVQDYF